MVSTGNPSRDARARFLAAIVAHVVSSYDLSTPGGGQQAKGMSTNRYPSSSMTSLVALSTDG
jgi:hypothetical protein